MEARYSGGDRSEASSAGLGGDELWLFTNGFPFGHWEPFLENELPILCARFKRVRIFPGQGAPASRPIPANAEVSILWDDAYKPATIAQLWRYRGSILLMLSSLVRDLRRSWPSWGTMRWLASRMRRLTYRLAVLEAELLPHYDRDRPILYSYWTEDWVTLLSLLQARHPEVRFISRAHGFDLYEDQSALGVIPFRRLQLRGVDRLFCVSRAGFEHMRKYHGKYAGKFELAPLGTTDHGAAERTTTGPLRVVSCSHVIDRKRVHLIVEALSMTTVPVHWTHFGDGPGMEAIRILAAGLPAHVQVDLRGAMDNRGIMDRYRAHPADVFLHMSRLEGGVAVVLQEAASFGIPLIAADSGGVRDIVVPATGILFPNNVKASEIAVVLNGFRSSSMATPEFREGVRRYWRENFFAGVTFNRFCDRLLEVHEEQRNSARPITSPIG